MDIFEKSVHSIYPPYLLIISTSVYTANNIAEKKIVAKNIFSIKTPDEDSRDKIPTEGKVISTPTVREAMMILNIR